MIISMNDNGIDIETIAKIADKDVLEVNISISKRRISYFLLFLLFLLFFTKLS
ncbi:MAG: hypothetical protein OSJ65_04200 [Bacilli bacterium]|nr:hypothetical protein [Bacilli bacterium]